MFGDSGHTVNKVTVIHTESISCSLSVILFDMILRILLQVHVHYNYMYDTCIINVHQFLGEVLQFMCLSMRQANMYSITYEILN